MDAFIKIIEQKKVEIDDTLHKKEIELLKKYIHENKNVFLCGSSGTGKSYILKAALPQRAVEIEKEHLKSSSQFLSLIQNTNKIMYIDEYDSDFKKIIESVSDGTTLTNGSLIVVSRSMCMFPNFETIFVPKRSPEEIMKLAPPTVVAQAAAVRAAGNIRDFFSYLEGYDQKDVFKTPKEYIKDILCDTETLPTIPDYLHEHGHVWDIFQENYLDSRGVNITETTDAFVEADVYDTKMYSTGDWHLMPYFTLNAVVIPKAKQGEPLVYDKIRPGSCWTKYGNYKMRKQKLKEIHHLGVDELCLLKKYAEKGDIKPMLAYGLKSQDFDVMNHLSLQNKLKQKDVVRIKKELKNAQNVSTQR